MNPQEAQRSIDDIRRLQDQTREQIIRHNSTRSYVPLSALGLFAVLASTDLQNPWRTVVLLLGLGLFAWVGIVHEHRALVHRKPTALEWLFWLGLSAGLMLLFGAFRIAAWAWLALPEHGLRSQGTVAAVATAAGYVAMAPLIRRTFRKIVLRGSGHA